MIKAAIHKYVTLTKRLITYSEANHSFSIFAQRILNQMWKTN